MFETYGLHQLIWNTAVERFPDVLVASAADAEGRGIKLLVMDNGSFVDLSDARCYLIWRHRRTGVRGTEEFDNADAGEGRFTVFYPAAMCGHTGTVDAQIMPSLGDDRFMSTRDFVIRVERVLVDGEQRDDGFTLFVEAIRAYEHADEVASEAAENINAMEVAAVEDARLDFIFGALANMESVDGLGNLGGILSASYCFSSCTGLAEADLSGMPLDVMERSGLSCLFYGDTALTTIYVQVGWSLPSGLLATSMFNNCRSLVGGAGTVYDSRKTGIEYFRIDNPPDELGYLTAR